MTITTSQFDIGKYLVDEESIANYLDDCMEEGGTPLFLKALGEVSRARGMTEIAENAGLTRASLYKSLGEGGNPALGTIEKVVESLGFRLGVVRKQEVGAGIGVAKTPAPKARIIAPGMDTRAVKGRQPMGQVEKAPAYGFVTRSNRTHDARVAEPGRFVSYQAKAHPRTTERENNRSAAKKKK